MVTLYPRTGIDQPASITTGPDGALWFTNPGNESIGRITTAGVISNYSGPGIDPTNFANNPADAPDSGLTTGPDGALWFTNRDNSIGRMTTTGAVSTFPNVSGNGIPEDITVGPDGNLWYADFSGGVGRITTAGTGTDIAVTGLLPLGIVTGPDGNVWITSNGGLSGGSFGFGTITPKGTFKDVPLNENFTTSYGPSGITVGPDGALWLADDDNIVRVTTAGVSTSYPSSFDPALQAMAITAGPDGALWFTNDTNSIGRITTAGVVTNYTDPASTVPIRITAGPDGALWFTNTGEQLDRADHHRRGGHELHRHRHQRTRAASPPGPTARCGSPTGHGPARLDRADHHAGAVTNYTDRRHRRARRGSPRARRGAVVHQPPAQLDRADHHRRGGHQLHRPRHRRTQRRSPPAPTARCGSPTWPAATTRSGGSPPPGWSPTTPTPASTSPYGITAGPDGALWFTNYGNNSIGRITTAGVVTNYTGPRIDAPQGDHRRARRGAVVHQPADRDSIGRITTAGVVTNYTGMTVSPARSPPDPTGPCGSPTVPTRSDASPSTGW